MTGFKPGDRVHMWGHDHTPATTGTVTGTTTEGRTLVRWDSGPGVTPHYPQHLEPLGEPMSKTFKSIAEGSNRTLTVLPALANDNRFRIEVEGETSIRGIILSTDDAAAIMLEVARSAGIIHHDPDDTPYDSAQRTENMGDLNMAAFYLARHVNESEKAAHVAADREALEDEALKLMNARRASEGRRNMEWNEVSGSAKTGALAIARAARELHGGTK